MGPLLEGLHPVVPDNGYANFMAAFRKRCNYHSSKRVTPRIVHDTRRLFDYLFEGRKYEKFEWNGELYTQWLAKFGAEKRQRMDKALEGMVNANLSNYTTKDVFVKVEALLVEHKPNWAPRVIYKGTDLYNAVSGPIFNELMCRFDHLLESRNGHYQFRLAYRKVPTDYTEYLEAHDYEGDEKPQWMETDFTANDMYQCRDVILFEVSFMRLLGCPEWFIRLHLKSGKFTVKSKEHRVKATLEHQLPTGATDTTFRNSLWNMIILHSFLLAIKARKSSAVILGDDMLAKVYGLKRYACKTYTSIASEAGMVVKAFRRSVLFESSFLSRLFVPCTSSMHLTVPILGKTLGRFNMRANNNDGLDDHAYMAGKSVGYAYEFRHLPVFRDIFLQRFVHEFSLVRDKTKGQDMIQISWNARSAGVTLKNIKDKLRVQELISEDDFFAFCYHRYGVYASEVIDLFEDVVLNTDKSDVSGVVVDILARDFLG
uniref:RNA-dependent RNA polymerase n=1 Tax=Grapevine-associated RNA virus 2 TaxID=2814388 RepID=A0A8F5RC92_9VIRU|nr:MAG: RNA-dependent RNA polymerase [Grapevine-associated RNA virus 2]